MRWVSHDAFSVARRLSYCVLFDCKEPAVVAVFADPKSTFSQLKVQVLALLPPESKQLVEASGLTRVLPVPLAHP